MTARQHHYVPQCYLKGFVSNREKPRLFAVDFKERRIFSPNPKNVAAERDFHTIDVEGRPPDALENAFSGFETELDQALKRIISARSIKNENDRALIFNLIGLMATKNPRLRENFRAAHERTAKMMMDLAAATPEGWAYQVRRAKEDGFLPADADADYEKMREFLNRDDFRIETETSMHLQMELQTFDKILPLIFSRRWMLFRTPPNAPGFITSDHPMCIMWSDPARRGIYPTGLGLRNTQLLFPISNELAIIGSFEIDDGDEVDADESLIAQINGNIILHSMTQVYGRDGNFPYMMNHHTKVMRGAGLLEDRLWEGP
ncbi:DUF4238 domain-containing protein [Methylocella silvestris]|nr:DUF4238 domain-containing protein [Methylocella silvestris]